MKWNWQTILALIGKILTLLIGGATGGALREYLQ